MDEEHHLCDLCRKIPIADYFHPGGYPRPIQLGHYHAIFAKKNCPFCKLVIQALKNNSHCYFEREVPSTAMCHLGRLNNESNDGKSEVWITQIDLTSKAPFVNHISACGQLIRLHLEGVRENLGLEYQAYGQVIGDQINMPLLQNWIQECTLHHGEECNPPVDHYTAKLSLYLVDVRRMCLVKKDWSTRYLALSYVWGNVDALNTTIGNVRSLQEDGAIMRNLDKIPNVIKDGIELVRKMGETYLWVDALSIIQNDSNFKAEFIPQMDKIFSRAFITIIALSSPDASHGLPGISSGSRRAAQNTAKLGPLTLTARLPILYNTYRESLWDKRAWTFQEGMLSRRKLYISETQMLWCCPESSSTEDYSKSLQNSENLFGCLFPFMRIHGKDFGNQFSGYKFLAEEYTRRQMTYASDSINAFAGILSALKEVYAWDFASALPERQLDIALLWIPFSSAKLRCRSLLGPDSHRMVCTSPTWCWTAWEGQVWWNPRRFHGYVDKTVTIKSSIQRFMIEDGGGRRIIGHRSVTDGHLNNEKKEAGVKYAGYNPSTQMILVFEARISKLESFKISEPQLKVQFEATHDEVFGNTDKFARKSCWLYDNHGHHCGTIFGIDVPLLSSYIPSQCEIVELSRCDQDEVTQADLDASRHHLPPEYPSAAEYYGEIFDATRYTYKRCWAVNFLLLEWKGKVAERIAIGQIHADAWDKAHQGIKQIALG